MADPSGIDDREVRHSLMIIERQRSRRLWTVVIGLIVVLGALAGATLLSYSEEPDAAKKTQPAE